MSIYVYGRPLYPPALECEFKGYTKHNNSLHNISNTQCALVDIEFQLAEIETEKENGVKEKKKMVRIALVAHFC